MSPQQPGTELDVDHIAWVARTDQALAPDHPRRTWLTDDELRLGQAALRRSIRACTLWTGQI